MANLSFLRADQHMLRLVVDDNDEGSNDKDITQAELIAACAAGPLKALFTSPIFEPPPSDGVASWGGLISDKRLSVKVTPGGASQSAGVGGFRFINGDPNIFRVTVTGGSVVVELRYHPTAVR